MSLTTLSVPTPWFPDDTSALSDPCLSTASRPPSRSPSLFSRRNHPRDAHHYELSPLAASTSLPFSDALELQDDSFVNFSVGNLTDRRNFSFLGVAKYVRSSTTSRSTCPAAAQPTSASLSSDDTTSSRYSDRSTSFWNRWKRREGSARLRPDSFLSPVRKCFY
eukprot:GFKZ01004217.1.p1 GENE.GFKZ01004217.1~~GFKZ01004217.1.p1  ORF type:complete len:174 (+),score=18.99 GFKZ01004217.1:31-522(+)